MEVAAKCLEKGRLLTKYQKSVQSYSEAVKELSEARPRVVREQYIELAMRAEQSRMSAEHARLALEKHTSEHGC